MVLEHARFRITVEKQDEFEAAFAGARHHIEGAVGCRRVSLRRSVDQAGTYLMEVDWARLEDHVVSFPGTEAASAFLAAIGPYIVGEPDVIHFEAD